MSDTGTVAVAASRRGSARPPAGEPTPADLERLAQALVRRLGAAKALLLASMIDEAAAEAADKVEGGA